MEQASSAVSHRPRTTTGRAERSEPAPAAHQPTAPILWWAALGAVFVCVALYVQGRWLLGGQAHHVGTGVTPVPTYMKVSMWASQIVFGLGSVACVYWFVIREKLRNGRIGFNGLLCLAFFTVWWQDAITNYLVAGFAWNSYLVNLGGWGQNIPGWASPNPEQSTIPIIWNLSFYIFASFVLLLLAPRQLRAAQTRWPSLKLPVLLGIYFVVLFFSSFAMEFLWVITGHYAYGAVIPSWTIFDGHYYQFPLYEALLAAAVFFAWTCLVFFKNDRGETLVERGLDRLPLSEGRKQFTRFLALAAALNVSYLLCYFIPMNAFQNQAELWPEDLQKRSYFVHDLCGQGTDVVCGKTELRIGPDGKIVAPEGAEVPKSVPFER